MDVVIGRLSAVARLCLLAESRGRGGTITEEDRYAVAEKVLANVREAIRGT